MRGVFELDFTYVASMEYLDLITTRKKAYFQKLERSSPRISRGAIDPAQDLRMLPFWIVANILYGELDPELESVLDSLAPLREDLMKFAIGGGLTRFSFSRYLPMRENKMLSEFQQRWSTFNDRARATAEQRQAKRAPIVHMCEAVQKGVCSMVEMLHTLDEMLFANLDVTLGGMTWNLVQLAANLDVQDRLRAEIAHARLAAEQNGGPNFAVYLTSSVTLLQAVISESSRLRPLAAFSVPQSAPTPRNLDGYLIPAGTNFIIDSHSLNENESFWGRDASKFRPERFLEHKPSETRYHFWRYGFGPRQCLGKHLADLILRILLIELLETYDLYLVRNATDWKRNEEVWIDHPEMELGCAKRKT